MDFRLLVKDLEGTSSSAITLDGQRWCLTDSLDIYSDTIPKYACVSYVWGPGRGSNPIHPTILMSDRTLSVLHAAVRSSNLTAFWIDAFCIPSDPARKSPTLESMGYIYGRADSVIAVLEPGSYAAAKKMSLLKKGETPIVELLDDLEKEGWVRSVWTYQEVVNGSNIFFVGEDTTGNDTLYGTQFLNALGYYLTKYREAKGLTGFDTRRIFPNLDTFEDLILDWQMSSYAERPALEIMSNMIRRSYDDEKNYFYSMIGALTQKPSQRSKKPSIENLAETFMTLAEEKGDYSFIFSSAPRDARPGLEWRPSPQLLRPIVPWHVDGEKLDGVRELNGIRLLDIIVTHPTVRVGEGARDTVYTWLDAPELRKESDDVLATRMCDTLKFLGFTGEGRPVLTELGFAFPQTEVPAGASIDIWVTPAIYYTFGAPAMIVAQLGQSTRYIPAVFAGLARSLKTRTEVFIPTSAARL